MKLPLPLLPTKISDIHLKSLDVRLTDVVNSIFVLKYELHDETSVLRWNWRGGKHQKFGAKVNPAVGRRWTVGSSFFFASTLIGAETCRGFLRNLGSRHDGCRRGCT